MAMTRLYKPAVLALIVSALSFAPNMAQAEIDPNPNTSGMPIPSALQGGYAGYGPMDTYRPETPRPVVPSEPQTRVAGPVVTRPAAVARPAPRRAAPVRRSPDPAPKARTTRSITVPDDFLDGVIIDVSDRQLYYIEDGVVKRTIPVAVPRRDATRIFGDTKITRKRPNPTWRPTPRMIKEDPSLPAVVKPGPSNPMGKRAMNLGWQYIAIHGTNNDRSIGRLASSGCYRMHNNDVEWLYQRSHVGMRVRVRK